MPRFAILRSAVDAGRDGMHVFKGYQVDPLLGEHGGFLLETVTLYQTVGEVLMPDCESALENIKRLRRRILDGGIERDGLPKPRNYWVCEAVEQDAIDMMAARSDWKYVRIYNDEQLEQMRTEYLRQGPGQVETEPDDEAEYEPDLSRETTGRVDVDEYRKTVKAKAREIMSAGGPSIKLSLSPRALERYNKQHEHLLRQPKAAEPDGENI